jgi:predicted ATP-dependent serine protease
MSQFHRKYYFGQEEEMKLYLMILSVPWYMFNGLEHTALYISGEESAQQVSERAVRLGIKEDVLLLNETHLLNHHPKYGQARLIPLLI